MSYDTDVQRETLKSGEDVDAILRIALQQEHGSEDELRQRLTRSAEELGISPESLAKAEKVYLLESKKAAEQQLVDEQIDRFMRAKQVGFKAHAIAFLCTNAFLHVIWYLTSRDFYWPGIVLAAWGMGIVPHYFFTKHRPTTNENDFQKWVELGQPSIYTQGNTQDGTVTSGITVGVHIPNKPKALEERE